MRPTIFLLSAALAACSLTACHDSIYGVENGDANQPISNDDKALIAAGGTTLTTSGAAQVLRATGPITNAVAQFRTLIGEPLNPNTAGEKANGRREINWDGVPAAVTNSDAFPANFFNVNSPRGLVMSTPGNGLRVSDSGFVEVNPTYVGGFNAFSPKKTFAPTGSTITDLQFFVAGSTTPARVASFGAVFAGVDRSGSAKIEFFDKDGKLLLTTFAPHRNDDLGLSFAGASFTTPLIARVRITTGQAALGPSTGDVGQAKGTFDLVVMDDFLYGEPHPIQ